MKRKLIGLIIAVLLAAELIPFAVFARTDETAEQTNPAPAPASATIELRGEEGEDVVDDLKVSPAINEATKATAFQTYDFEYSSNSEFTDEWALYDADGDGFNWEWFSSPSAASGSGLIMSASFDNDSNSALTPDNWAVSPGVALPAAALSPYMTFCYAAADPNYPIEYFEVYAATTRTMSGATLLFSATSDSSTWIDAACDLSAFAGRTVYIAFRHCNSTDMFMICVDCVRFYQTDPASLNEAANGPGNKLLFTSEGNYPWTVAYDGSEPYARSGNEGVASSSSVLNSSVNAQEGDTLKFDFMAWGEGSAKAIWDKCIFSVNGSDVQIWGAYQNNSWETFSYTIPADGTYDLSWTYSKDSSVNPTGDYFAIDNVRLEKGTPDNLIAGYYFEDDGTGSPSWMGDWYTADNDGDGNKWVWGYNEGLAPYCYEGSGMYASLSSVNGAALTPDNWVIVGPITLKPSQNLLRFHAGGIGNDSQNQEHFRLYYNTSLSGSWTSITGEITTNGEYQTYEVNLDSFAGQSIYVAFRHFNCTNQNMLRLDAVQFFGSDEVPQPIDTVEINGFVVPEWGETPNTSQTVPSGVHYTLNNTAWAYRDMTNGNQAQLPAGEIFNNPNYEYYQIFLILADTGYQFADNVTFMINGDTSLVQQTSYNSANNYYLVYTRGFTVVDPASLVIDTVEILGYVEPEWGASPNFGVTVPAGAHYTLDFCSWEYCADGMYYNLTESDHFDDPNCEYFLYCRIRADEGWYFADSVTVIYNGNAQPASQDSIDDYFWFETEHVTVSAPPAGLLGDIDGSGSVTSVDAVYALRYAMNIISLDADQLARGDVDGSGAVNTSDAVYIMRYAMGIISSFPAE